jgi:hypothetical protein
VCLHAGLLTPDSLCLVRLYPDVARGREHFSVSALFKVVESCFDDSDTTYFWAEFLSRVSPEGKAGPGTGLNVNWPVGLGAKGDDGVEDLIIGPTGDYGINDLFSDTLSVHRPVVERSIPSYHIQLPAPQLLPGLTMGGRLGPRSKLGAHATQHSWSTRILMIDFGR